MKRAFNVTHLFHIYFPCSVIDVQTAELFDFFNIF